MLQAVAAAVAEGAARGVAVAAGGAQPIPVVFHQLQVGSVHCRNIAAQDLFTQGFIDGKNAGAAGAGGKVLHPKLEQGDEKEVKGSLRFNYMVPVPDECIEKLVIKDVEDEKYRILLNKEYQFCMDNAEKIQKKANKIYEMVTTNRKQILTDNSCAFHILEAGCREYIEKYLSSESKK